MKTRDGFVSNSSSTSFVVLLPKKPSSADELREMLFPAGNKESDLYEDSYFTIGDISKFLFENLTSDSSQILGEISSMFRDEEWGVYKISKNLEIEEPPSYKREDNLYDDQMDRYAEKIFHYLSQDPESYLCTIECEDHKGGIEAEIEVSNPFSNVKNIEISHH